MGMTLAEKIIASHLIEGRMEPGSEIAIRADQWLSHDMNAPMGFLGFETLGIPRVQVPLAVLYTDHNLVQVDYKTPDDFAYLQSIAQKYGIHFSRAGNGICHITHTHRFAVPGQVLIGADSHTTMSSSVGMLAIGVGGLDGALILAGEPFYFKMPQIMGVRLTGKRRAGVGSKDLMLELLRRLSVKGGVGYILEYFGPGLEDLDVSERATLTNMGAELGATTSIFPSDALTRAFLRAQRREQDWTEQRTRTPSTPGRSRSTSESSNPSSPNPICRTTSCGWPICRTPPSTRSSSEAAPTPLTPISPRSRRSWTGAWSIPSARSASSSERARSTRCWYGTGTFGS